jgi:hypothetical protein
MQDKQFTESDRAAIQVAFDAHLDELAKIDASFSPRLADSQHGEYAAYATLWAEHRIALTAERERFAAACLAMIGEERADLWRAFDQDVRRHRVIAEIAEIAEIVLARHVSLDVGAMLEECSLTDEQRASISGMLEAYNSELDQFLRRFEQQYPVLLRERFANAAPEDLKRIDDQQGALIEQCLAMPYATIERIADALGDDARDCMLRQAACATNPRLCGPSPVEEAMRLLRACDLLTAEQRAASEQIFAEYLPQYLANRVRFVQAQSKWDEPKRKQARAQRRQELIDQHVQWKEAWANHPGEDALLALHKMQRENLQRLRGLFDDTQFAALPPAMQYVLEM